MKRRKIATTWVSKIINPTYYATVTISEYGLFTVKYKKNGKKRYNFKKKDKSDDFMKNLYTIISDNNEAVLDVGQTFVDTMNFDRLKAINE